jgi:hypothetical protein
VLLALGVLGFVPAVTTGYGGLAFSGDGSGAKLIGLFQVSVLLNLLHAVAGAAAFPLARTPLRAALYLTGAGVFLLALALAGAAGARSAIPLNRADNWLHLALGLVLIGLAYSAAER